MTQYGLLGETLRHSFSPRLHKALAGYEYALLPTPPDKVAKLLHERNFRGLNVTLPYKQTVIPLCDEVDPRAAAIGAVNTLVNRNGRLIGYNTDIDGLIYMAKRAGVEITGKNVLILGSGGTSRTAQAAARELGAASITVISRRGEDNYRNIARHQSTEVIINTTPVGMFPQCGASPVDISLFPALTGVLDVVYNPLRTALIMQAEERKIPCSSGLPMLVAQARRAAELFTDCTIPDQQMEDVLENLTAELTNIILIGMPGCGKTTIGAALAKSLNRDFVDLDQMIEGRAGKSIPRIFAEDGEEPFRALERECIREIGAATGRVISTGGGCVTREENYAPLHQNGVVVHLTRPLDLLPTEGRPISQRTNLAALWQQRKVMYERFADLTVPNTGTPTETAERIGKELRNL